MRLPRLLYTVSLLIVCGVLFIALTYDAFSDDLNRKNAAHLEMRAAQRLDYAAADPASAAEHLRLHEQYRKEASEIRGTIGWGRMRSLPLIGLMAGYLAWQLRLRWLAVVFALWIVAALLLSSAADQLLGGLGPVTFALIGVLPTIIGALLVFASQPGSDLTSTLTHEPSS